MEDSSSSNFPSWCLIESDPAVFSELVEKIGVKNVQFEELYTLDDSTFEEFLRNHENIYGFIFLFKWKGQLEKSDNREIDKEAENYGLFFAKQMIENGCATQAILSVLMNCTDKVDIGEELKTLKEFCLQFDAQMRGLSISNSEKLRNAHNSFKQKSAFEFVKDDDYESEKEDAYHFISYVPFMDRVYELDGLKEGPICLGEISDEKKWETIVKEEIQKRVERGGGGDKEFSYNLLAVVNDKLENIRKLIEIERHVRHRATLKLITILGEDMTIEDEMDDSKAPPEAITYDKLPETKSELQSLIAQATLLIDRLREQEEEEQEKRAKWKKENVRRRHDFIPFILCAMREMARRGELMEAFMTSAPKHLEKAEEGKELKKSS